MVSACSQTHGLSNQPLNRTFYNAPVAMRSASAAAAGSAMAAAVCSGATVAVSRVVALATATLALQPRTYTVPWYYLSRCSNSEAGASQQSMKADKCEKRDTVPDSTTGPCCCIMGLFKLNGM